MIAISCYKSICSLGSDDSCPPTPPTLGSSKVGEVAQRSADRFMLIQLQGGRPEMFEEQRWLGLVDGPLSSAVANPWTKLQVE